MNISNHGKDFLNNYSGILFSAVFPKSTESMANDSHPPLSLIKLLNNAALAYSVECQSIYSLSKEMEETIDVSLGYDLEWSLKTIDYLCMEAKLNFITQAAVVRAAHHETACQGIDFSSVALTFTKNTSDIDMQMAYQKKYFGGNVPTGLKRLWIKATRMIKEQELKAEERRAEDIFNKECERLLFEIKLRSIELEMLNESNCMPINPRFSNYKLLEKDVCMVMSYSKKQLSDKEIALILMGKY